MPLFKVTHNEDKAYVFADCLSDAINNWATAESKRTGDEPGALEPNSVIHLADDDQIVASDDNGNPAYADDIASTKSVEDSYTQDLLNNKEFPT